MDEKAETEPKAAVGKYYQRKIYSRENHFARTRKFIHIKTACVVGSDLQKFYHRSCLESIGVKPDRLVKVVSHRGNPFQNASDQNVSFLSLCLRFNRCRPLSILSGHHLWRTMYSSTVDFGELKKNTTNPHQFMHQHGEAGNNSGSCFGELCKLRVPLFFVMRHKFLLCAQTFSVFFVMHHRNIIMHWCITKKWEHNKKMCTHNLQTGPQNPKQVLLLFPIMILDGLEIFPRSFQ